METATSLPRGLAVRPPWRWLALGAVTAFALVQVLTTDGTARRSRAIDPRCETWDRQASGVIVGLVGEHAEAAEMAVRVALFHLRRARRNCREGWVETAYRDYSAVLKPPAGMFSEARQP
jgi:hypothetical protein